MFNAARTTIYAANYDPYGQIMAQYLPDATPSFGFTGQMTDASGLQYLRARYYDPSLGAFLSQDPKIGAYPQLSASWNGYNYAHANPTTLTDPTGENPLLIFGVALLGGLIGGTTYGVGSQVAHHLDEGASLPDAIRHIDAQKASFFGLVGAGLGASLGLGLLSPQAAAIGAVSNIGGGVISGHSTLEELTLDGLIGWTFGGIAGKFISTNPYSAKTLIQRASTVSRGVLVRNVTRNASIWGTFNAIQGSTTRFARSELFGVSENITPITLASDFAIGFSLSGLYQLGVDSIVKVRLHQSDISISSPNAWLVAGIANDLAENFDNSLFGMVFGNIIFGTNVGGAFISPVSENEFSKIMPLGSLTSPIYQSPHDNGHVPLHFVDPFYVAKWSDILTNQVLRSSYEYPQSS